MREEPEESGADREAQLLHGDTDQYGIYQLKDNPELLDFHFAGTEELLKRGILSDDFGKSSRETITLSMQGAFQAYTGSHRGRSSTQFLRNST